MVLLRDKRIPSHLSVRSCFDTLSMRSHNLERLPASPHPELVEG